MEDEGLRRRWEYMQGLLDESQRRAFAAAEAKALGYGGIARVMRVTGLARATIAAGLRDPGRLTSEQRVRHRGGGRIPIGRHDPTVVDELRRLIAQTPRLPSARPPSLRDLSLALACSGRRISHTTIGRLLRSEGITNQRAVARITPRRTSAPVAVPPASRGSDGLDDGAPGRNFVASFAHGLAVIDAFDHQRPRLSIAQVAEHCGLTRAAARRYLITLQQLGYVAVHHRMFTLTPKVMRLGQSFLYSSRLPEIIQPELIALATTLQEASSAGVLEGNDVISIAATTAGRPVSRTVQSGTRVPAYCTSNGRVLLSAWSREWIRGWIAHQQLQPRTRFTITGRKRLLETIDRTREQGYAVVDQEFEIGLRTVAVPLIDHRGETIASLNVSVDASRVSIATLVSQCLPALQAAQARLRTIL